MTERRLFAVACKGSDLTRRVAEATEGEDLAPLLRESLRSLNRRRARQRAKVHRELNELVRPVPYVPTENSKEETWKRK